LYLSFLLIHLKFCLYSFYSMDYQAQLCFWFAD